MTKPASWTVSRELFDRFENEWRQMREGASEEKPARKEPAE
ncbi:hypothetical protein [Pararhizobium arenae]|nr:hypothetical protein [Pararhizobium arenae]